VRPARLELENFLSYSEPTSIDFEGLSAVVIVGPNGAGKTSIIEAIGWALFGKGRGRSPDDFVSHGRTTCRVSFEFHLGEARYRVGRQRDLASGGKSYLGLEVDTNDFDGFGRQPVGGDSIAETQAAIEQLLGLTYDQWLATSFIGQNRADQFTRLTPAGRKELLAEVLQLDVYARLHDAAQARARELAGQSVTVQHLVEDLEDVVSGQEAAKERAVAAVDARVLAEAAVARLEEDYANALDSLELAQKNVGDLARIRVRLQELRNARAVEASRLDREIRQLEDDRARAKKAWADCLRAIDAMQASAADVVVDARASALWAQADAMEVQVVELRAERETCGKEAAAALERIGSHVDVLKTCRERLGILGSVPEGETVNCYACGSSLSYDAFQNLVQGLEAEVATREQLIGEQRAAVERAQEDDRQFLEELRRTETHRDALRKEAQELRTRAARAAAAAERIPEEESRLELSRRSFEGLQSRLEQAVDGRRRSDRISDEERALAAELDVEGDLELELAAARDHSNSLNRGLTAARGDVVTASVEEARAADGLALIRKAREDLAATMQELGAVADRRWAYETLALAFGRDGIPTLIVENAVPQIEDEANRLLARWTDGEFTVRLDSLRALKTGGIRETLDIHVADQTAERLLEALSGGERQCVDLALAIALSRLMAHRAGRRIETLILDEPFTALDASHRQRTIEVLHELTEEFPSLILVTHLADLADAFPSRIVVTKEGGSSRIQAEAPVIEVAA
jgi:exonuclease SbcC